MKVSRWAVNRSMGSSGNRPGMNVPIPEAMVKVMKDRLKVAALTSAVVVSARYAFQVDRYMASPMPPTIADKSIRKMLAVIPGMTMMKLVSRPPASIMCLRPWRSDSTANGMLNITVVSPKIVRRAPTFVTDMPWRGRKTVIATS